MAFDEKLLKLIQERKAERTVIKKRKQAKKTKKIIRDWSREYYRKKAKVKKDYLIKVGALPNKKKTNKKTVIDLLYTLDEVKELIKEEGITNHTEYERWHKFNAPVRVPLYPNLAYRYRGWAGWRDFLGNKEPKLEHIEGWKYRPLSDAKAFVKHLRLKSKNEWIEYTKSGKKPDDIPTRPDFYYRRSSDFENNGVWLSWNDFLGITKEKRVEKVIEQSKLEPMLYVLKPRNAPDNVFVINVTYAGRDDIPKLMERHHNPQIVCLYYYSIPDINLPHIMKLYCRSYAAVGEDYYMVNNIGGFMAELSNSLIRVPKL